MPEERARHQPVKQANEYVTWTGWAVLWCLLVPTAALPAEAAGLVLPWFEVQKLIPEEGGFGDTLGWSVSLDGDVAVGGAYGATIDGNAQQGAAYIFRKVDGVWADEQKLTASDGAAGERFGRSVAIDGDTVVVGAYLAAVGGVSGQGAAYVFERVGGVWVERQKLTASDGVKQDRLGDPVALEGNTIMAAAGGADIGGNSAQGAVYVFERSGAVWSETQKLTIAKGTQADALGLNGLVIRNSRALVGAQNARVDGVKRGAAYFFERRGEVWSEGQRLVASDGMVADAFGSAVDFDDRTAVIGADQADPGGVLNQGVAYVFRLQDDVWVEQQKLVAFDGNEFSGFGKAVAVEGSKVLVGGEFDEPGMPAIGAVYSYRSDGARWTLDQKILASDSKGINNFGDSLDIQRDVLLVGASSVDPTGALYVFQHRPLFADGFESGDTTAWSATVP